MSIRNELSIIEQLLKSPDDEASREAVINIAFSILSQTFDCLEASAQALNKIANELEFKRRGYTGE